MFCVKRSAWHSSTGFSTKMDAQVFVDLLCRNIMTSLKNESTKSEEMNPEEVAKKLYFEKEYHRVIDLAHSAQTNVEVLYLAAQSLEQLGKPAEIIVSMLNRILNIQPRHISALRSLAWHSTSEEKRVEILDRMAHDGLCDDDDYYLLGECYKKMGKLNEAHHWFQKTLEKSPKHCYAFISLAELHVMIAIKYLQDAENIGEIDMNEQMSTQWDSEEVLRFMYDNITKKDLGAVSENWIPTA